MNDSKWLVFWRLGIYLLLIRGIIGGTWVSLGGMFDLQKMYKKLSSEKVNALDDGRVSGDLNLADKVIFTENNNLDRNNNDSDGKESGEE